MKKIVNLNNILSSFLIFWLRTHGFPNFTVSFNQDDEFLADIDNNNIEITLYFSEKDSDEFVHTFEEQGINHFYLSYFTFAFFHELGHMMTDYYLTDDDWAEWERIYKDDEMPNTEYFKTKVEQFATHWATQYMNGHRTSVLIFDFITTIIINLLCRFNEVKRAPGRNVTKM